MVLIVSSEYDHSTNEVIKWLVRYKIGYVRLGQETFIDGFTVSIDDESLEIEITINGEVINFSKIQSFWLRKGTIGVLTGIKLNYGSLLKIKCPKFEKYLLEDELGSIREFLFHQLERKKHLGSFRVGEGNKLISFDVAKECGLKIPSTFVSTSIKALVKKLSEEGLLMAKPIEDGYAQVHNGVGVISKYDMISPEVFNERAEHVFPSCLQEYQKKKIELRIFYMKGVCYAMAIFSQNDPKTKVDFRNYNNEAPNRMVPYNLPRDVESSIDSFMNKMKLNTGSLDFILTDQNEYVFLEVNPAGQYGMVSQPCNYSLDRLIAENLSTHNG